MFIIRCLNPARNPMQRWAFSSAREEDFTKDQTDEDEQTRAGGIDDGAGCDLRTATRDHRQTAPLARTVTRASRGDGDAGGLARQYAPLSRRPESERLTFDVLKMG